MNLKEQNQAYDIVKMEGRRERERERGHDRDGR